MFAVQDGSGYSAGVDVAKPSKATLAQHGKHAGRVGTFQDLRVWYILPTRDIWPGN